MPDSDTTGQTQREDDSMKVDPSNYDYVMYVDASGDDGFKFEEGSSSCYCAAALLVKQEDIAHNLAILEQIKKIVGCKATDEVKYSKIRRHRRGPEALGLLRELKGKMSCYLTFKKELTPEEVSHNGAKFLSVSCHAMALTSIDYFDFKPNEKVLIAIDRMKHTEEAPLEHVLSSGPLSNQQHPERNFSNEVVFRDSKDSNFLLIQIADLLCGTIREHFEQYEVNPDMLYFKGLCPNCMPLQLNRTLKKAICKKGQSRAAKILHSKNFHYIFHLFPQTKPSSIFRFFFVHPKRMIYQHAYIYCPKK